MADDTRLRIDLAYDGTGFSGWAAQPARRTVEGELSRALAVALHTETPPRLVVAGRTDAGVHASGQVAHVDLDSAAVVALTRGQDVGSIARRLTGILGRDGDLVVRGVSVAPPGFDARFAAVARRYAYRLADAAAARDPLERHRTALHPGALDVEAMRAVADGLTGLRDFAAFCKPRPEATTIRTLTRFAWRRDAAGVLVADVEADAFCHSMVRSLVGASIAAGSGRIPVAAVLTRADGSERFPVAPAKGLTLVEVRYPPDAELAAQSARARARRRLSDSVDVG